ncbi:MAG: eukaryotic translation initiation factor 3 subunit E, partial [Cyanobacteria bacterium]|nr:eukaryotic translation initiation factor 3 subunit E [Cyanobacteriota bacterium]
CFSALWGQLAGEILTQDWDSALENLHALKDLIESRTGVSQTTLLRLRTWLMHWSLFVFFNHPSGRTGIIDLFFQEKYLNAIQVAAPHLLRYLATSVITNKRRRLVLNELVTVLKAECHSYSDPITEFLECLYVKFDFDSAQQKLIECETVLANDFFLVACRDEFVENARLFIFETYCRIHSCIDLSMLSEKLNMDPEDAERWIVNLIRNAKIDAKIDSAANQVVMGNPSISIYQRIIENTRNLCTRTHTTYQALSNPQLS